MRAWPVLLFALLAGCSGSEPQQKSAAPAALPADESRWLPSKDQVNTQVLAEHLIDSAIPPGGTIGNYKDAGSSYQLGLIHMASNDKAAFLLLDVKKIMETPQYLPNMGGFFGMRNGVPLYVFAKGKYVAMVKGLPMDRADPIARTFAARIPI